MAGASHRRLRSGRSSQERPRSSRRTVALVLVMALAAGWFLFFRGDSENGPVAVPVIPGAADVPDSAPEDNPTRDESPIETFKVFAPKDPFNPLVAASGGGGINAEGSTTTGGASSGRLEENPSGSDVATVGGHTLRLLSITGVDTAELQVDKTVFRIKVGQVFARSFKLLAIEHECASALYGDEPLTLCSAS